MTHEETQQLKTGPSLAEVFSGVAAEWWMNGKRDLPRSTCTMTHWPFLAISEAAEYMAGAAAHDAGKPTFVRSDCQSDRWKRHRAGWLWAEYKDRPSPYNSTETKVRIVRKAITIGTVIDATAILNLTEGTWYATLCGHKLESRISAVLLPAVAAALFPIEAERFKWKH